MSSAPTGRTILITGAGRGIGRSIALALAQEGARMTLIARTREQLEKVAVEVKERGAEACVVVADMLKDDDVNRSVSEAQAAFGPVDVLVNNAGSNTLGTIDKLSVPEWWDQVVVNLKAPYLYCRALMPTMMERGFGRIVNISSTSGKIGMKFSSAYCAAKHGVIGMTRALAHDVGDSGVTVNAVCPGYTITDLTDHTMAQREQLFGAPADAIRQQVVNTMIPQKKPLEPDDVAGLVAFLVSPAGARITGQALTISGGMVMH